jgi:CDP-glycerol glycerophosphotransferase
VSARQRVLFSSWNGAWSDSPRAIADELRARRAPLDHVWVIRPGAPAPAPAEATVVAPGSPEHRRELERARYIVVNDVLGDPFRKAPRTTYLQTWHGTPLKRIAYDVDRASFPGSEHHYAVELPRDVGRWDLLLSPNAFSTPVLRRSFRYEGPVLESGYPRNDLLLAPERDAVRARTRAELGLEDGVRAVLYAPTWRDGDPFELALDLEEVTRALDEEVVLLIRAHGLVAHTDRERALPGVRSVTRHPDIRALYLAADVLLTDYSSAMFDFAITGKPLLFYTYDLARYRDEVRGFTFAFEAEAPGPLLATTEEVIAALRDLDGVRERHAEAYAAFRARFCHLEDGRASARVVDAVFGPDAPPRSPRSPGSRRPGDTSPVSYA